MVKLSIIALSLISAVGVQACTYCQCLFDNGNHCCLYKDSDIGNLDCKAICSTARRHDGTVFVTEPGPVVKYGTACSTNGNYKCATVFQYKKRDSRIGKLDCGSICAKARRRDGTTWISPDHAVDFGTPCDASAGYQCSITTSNM
ncbi:hypothetical protein NHQ30_004382 [Ciborinia camelliae]|nr:hypothetical protein NHQ30_004382 [Ciborinia camelliae]